MTDSWETTVQLVRDAQSGDRQALETLFARYLPRVRQIVALRLGFRPSQFDVQEEVVQEALVNTFRRLDRYEERSEATFRNWISQCVANSIREHFRSEGALKRGGGRVKFLGAYENEDLSAIVLEGDAPTPSAIFGRKETIEKIEDALLGMKEHWREVLIHRLLCEMSYAEIGEEMGIREDATIRKMFSRALSELRRACGVESE